MKKFLCAIAAVSALAVVAYADLLLSYDFAAYAGTETVGTNNAALTPGIQTPSLITRGSGIAASANGGRFNAQGWDGFTTANDANTGGNYFEFSIVADSGYTMSITSLFFQAQRSNTGASNLVLRSSLDSFTADLGTLNNFAGANATAGLTTDLSGNSSFQNVSGTITFRVIGYTGATGGSTGFEGTGNDIAVFGTVVPEPGTAAMIVMGLGALIYARRRVS